MSAGLAALIAFICLIVGVVVGCWTTASCQTKEVPPPPPDPKRCAAPHPCGIGQCAGKADPRCAGGNCTACCNRHCGRRCGHADGTVLKLVPKGG